MEKEARSVLLIVAFAVFLLFTLTSVIQWSFRCYGLAALLFIWKELRTALQSSNDSIQRTSKRRGAFLRFAPRYGNLSINLPMERKPVFDGDISAYPSQLRVEGNNLVDATGQVVTLRGLMPSDPAVLRRKGRFVRLFFDGMADWGANVIRLPVHPERWEHDPDYLWRYLEPVVKWNGENGVYTILDLHFIGDIGIDRSAQMPDIQTPSQDFALDFWRQVAAFFKDTPHVIFEIFNEPAGISATVIFHSISMNPRRQNDEPKRKST